MAITDTFLRWAGGKRWLARRIKDVVAKNLRDGRYYEPFLGSGCMFFALEPRKALLSDLNNDLIIAFQQVALHPAELCSSLLELNSNQTEYMRIRRWDPQTTYERAIRFIYLNRNCWGGLYRENMSGVFNVPYGGGERNHKPLCESGALGRASGLLNKPGIDIALSDFQSIIDQAGGGDVIYCDPTYRGKDRDGFDRYGKNIFTWEDQQRLATAVNRAFERGALVVVSNVFCRKVLTLYPNAGVLELTRRKGLGTNGSPETRVEYLFVLDPKRRWADWREVGRINPPKRTTARVAGREETLQIIP